MNDSKRSDCFEVNLYRSEDLKANYGSCRPAITISKYLPHDDLERTKSLDRGEKGDRKPSKTLEIRVYRRRFIMLILFAFCSMMNGLPQFQYTVVADIVACYYGVGLSDVNWTSVVYMVGFLPLVFPVMYLMDKKGLRLTLILGAVFNCLGSLVQCFSLSPDRYMVIMVCQSLYSIGQVLVLSLPPFMAGVWFGAGEVGLACAFGVFGNQLGVALGFIIPPSLMTNDCQDKVDITYELSLIAYPMAVVNTILLVVLLLVFQERPDSYPSVAQATKENGGTDYVKSLKSLFKDKPFILLLLGYGLITGAYFAMSTIMNEMVLIHFPGEEVDAGWMGAIMVFAGMAGSVVLGAFLDRTHKYKQTSIFVFIVSFVLMVCYTVLIQLEKLWIQFLFFSLLGFIMTGYLPAGFDFGAEIAYPQPEAMSASLLNASTQVFSIILTNIASPLLQTYGDFFSNIFFCFCLLVGIIVMACIKCELKRTIADTGSGESGESKPQ